MSADKATHRGAAAEPQMRASGGANHSPREVTSELTVRPALAGDLTPLSFFFDTMLRQDYFLRRGQLAELLNGRHHQVFVAEIDTVLVGVAITTRGARLVNALVHPAYRGLGIGKALVDRSGAREVRAKLDMSSGDPRAFYRAMGFRGTGEFNRKGNIELMRRESGEPGAARQRGRGEPRDRTRSRERDKA
ncbi:MAG: GNAT family N-acetyltransferase [Phycisphaerae bacterium]